ncbi:MAG: YeaH/YhbH family protein [Rhodospirillales bacterium]|nr:YeaH/YhbH family protein [Rhodospirillales bacterium]
MHIVDRRLNPSGKNLANRQRFMRRAKSMIRKAVHESSGSRSIRDADQGGEVVLPAQGVHEPSLHRAASGGIRDHLLPGNKEYVTGDTIPRPQGGQGGGGSEGSPDGEGQDDFRFALSQDEFVDLFLEDLELPDLAKRKVVDAEALSWSRAGYSVSGSPANLALNRTVRNSLSRRIALKRPKTAEIEALRAQIAALADTEDEADRVRLRELEEELTRKLRRTGVIPYIDPIDVRYKRFESHPKPVAQAVMFCLMDVSGSMTEHMKDLAKRFYILLYIFLKRRYKNVDVVFIRHTHQASEVDEDTFFHSPETGGTVVSTALEEMQRVVEERYSPDNWNIYAAQASDGDNTASDNDKTAALLVNEILPVCQYYAYLEVGRDSEHFPPGFIRRDSDLWQTYSTIIANGAPMAMRKVGHRRDIYPVFRELFARKTGAEATTA